MLAQGLLLSGGSVSFESEAESYFARIPVVVSQQWKRNANDFIRRLKDCGVYPTLDAVHLQASDTPEVAQTNVISSSFTLTPFLGVTFTANRGYSGNAVDGYLGLGGTVASTSKGVQDSMAIGVYIIGGTDAAVTKIAFGNVGSTSNFALRPRDASNLFDGPLNSATLSSFGTVATILGDSVSQRTGATALIGYRNGVPTVTDNETSAARTASQMCLLRGGTIYADYLIGIDHVGSSLTDAQAAAFYDAKRLYLNARGAL